MTGLWLCEGCPQQELFACCAGTVTGVAEDERGCSNNGRAVHKGKRNIFFPGIHYFFKHAILFIDVEKFSSKYAIFFLRSNYLL